MRKTLTLLALCLAMPCGAQITASASLVGVAHSSAGWGESRDKEAFGIRFRTPAYRKITAQAGYTMTADNGIVFPTDAGMKHFAVAAEYAVTPWWRAQGIYGILLEFRDAERTPPTVPRFTYYRIVAVGNEFHKGAYSANVERLLSAPMANHAPLHHWIIKAHGPAFDVMVKNVGASPNNAQWFAFWTADATVRPFGNAPSPFKYLGVQGGTRPMLDTYADQSRPVSYLAFGMFVGFRE